MTAASAESAVRLRWPPPADRRQTPPATAGSPPGQRRPTGGLEAAGSARKFRTAVRRERTRRDCGTDRVDRGTDRWTESDRSDRLAAVITAIAVTVNIVARRGAADMSERPAQRVWQQCRFVDDEP